MSLPQTDADSELCRWLMLANSLEGLKDFFEEYGWFECQITVLDDTLGPVATGSVEYSYG